MNKGWQNAPLLSVFFFFIERITTNFNAFTICSGRNAVMALINKDI